MEPRPKLELSCVLNMNEAEARALHVLCQYGDGPLLKIIGEISSPERSKIEEGLRSLVAGIRQTLPPILHQTDQARNTFNR